MELLLTDWGQDRFVRRPPSSKARIDHMSLHLNNSGPFSDCVRVVFDCYSMVCARVVALFSRSTPPTVLGAIASGVVDAIKTFPLWLFPHVIEKCLERVTPCRAYVNPSAAVVTEAFIVRVFAALYHAKPNLVRQCVRLAVCCVSNFDARFIKTATRTCTAIFQVATIDSRRCPTRTQALPVRTATLNVRKRLNGQTTKRLSGQIKTFHNILRRCVRKEGCMEGSRKLLFGRSTLSIPEYYNTHAMYEVMS